MAYATSVYPAKAALFAILQGWVWPEGAPDVRWGPPTEIEDQTYDMVCLAPTNVPEDQPIVLGAQRWDERYTIRVLVDVVQWGDDEQATEQRAWLHFNQLLTAVVQNRTLSGTVREAQTFSFQQTNPTAGPQQWRSQILVEIGVLGVVFP